MSEPISASQLGSHRRAFVQTSDALTDAVASLEQPAALGVDLEMGQRVERHPGGYQEWKHILALIQIASDRVSLVIDPRRCADLSPLAPLLLGSARKVFLGGGQDVALLDDAGIPVRNLVDVGEVGLGIWGRREDGMAALARRMFNISLDKTVRRADWLARPLNPALLTYAHQDAELTLMIYRWMQRHHAAEVAFHERHELDPTLPAGTAAWLVGAMKRNPTEVDIALAECGLQRLEDTGRLTSDVLSLLRQRLTPRQLSRLLRLVGELELRDIGPEIEQYAESPTSLVRAALARALGSVGDLERVELALERLARDPVEDVRRAAAASAKELRRPKQVVEASEDSEEDDGSLNEETRSALQALMLSLEEGPSS